MTERSDVTLREVVRLVFWPRRNFKGGTHLGAVGSAAGLVVAAMNFPSPQWRFVIASFALGALGAFLGRSLAVALLLCGYLH